jgi:hypothetical protein
MSWRERQDLRTTWACTPSAMRTFALAASLEWARVELSDQCQIGSRRERFTPTQQKARIPRPEVTAD